MRNEVRNAHYLARYKLLPLVTSKVMGITNFVSHYKYLARNKACYAASNAAVWILPLAPRLEEIDRELLFSTPPRQLIS